MNEEVMATKTTGEKPLAEQPYFGKKEQQPEEQASNLFMLGDADNVALSAVRALTEIMNASGRMGEQEIFDASAAMRSDLLLVQQSLTLSPDELDEKTAKARARLEAHAVPGLEAMQQAMEQRLARGDLPEGLNAETERKAVSEAFGRVLTGFEQLIIPAVAPEQTPPSSVSDTLHNNFEKQQERYAAEDKQQSQHPGSHTQAVAARREEAMAAQQGGGRGA